ncbi:beta-phosphoglucomutase [Halobacillus amylolyticus]|uniref:Beta-phosphoglucomutase n=1 Tax=Halobacillus amylolyticus TaxID=2932259 RepID=A0ABY4HFF1_9BACI|nr:beta-phosphoglucomutase [Halobacillus amylolyticus]UOR13614.1 beta-phosphoglucomutase [Halobacillus amylolyticus]
MTSKHIEAVVFDLDGVITDTAHYHYLAWKQLADELGIPFDEDFNENLKGVSRVESLTLILANGNQSDAYTDSEIEDLASQKNEYYKQLIQQLTPEDILPGMKELIEEIRSESIPVGLASVSKNAQTVLHALEIEHLFDYCADVAKIKQSKPDPEIFLTVCEALEADPAQSIGVEDAKVGVQSIQGSGMYAVGVGSYLEQADLMVNETTELSWTQIKQAFLHKQ